MLEFNADSLARLGITFERPEDAAALCEALRDEYYARLGEEIPKALTPKQLEEYDDTPLEELGSWLDANFPNYTNLCARAFAQVVLELFLHRHGIHGASVSTAPEDDETCFIDFMFYLPVSFRKWMISNGVYAIGQFFGKLDSFCTYMAQRPVPASFAVMQLWDYLTEGAQSQTDML